MLYVDYNYTTSQGKYLYNGKSFGDTLKVDLFLPSEFLPMILYIYIGYPISLKHLITSRLPQIVLP